MGCTQGRHEEDPVYAKKVQELIHEPWVEIMHSIGQGAACEHIAAHIWDMEGYAYGVQPGDHACGQQTTEVLMHKRQTRAELVQYVDAVRNHYRELRGSFLLLPGNGMRNMCVMPAVVRTSAHCGGSTQNMTSF